MLSGDACVQDTNIWQWNGVCMLMIQTRERWTFCLPQSYSYCSRPLSKSCLFSYVVTWHYQQVSAKPHCLTPVCTAQLLTIKNFEYHSHSFFFPKLSSITKIYSLKVNNNWNHPLIILPALYMCHLNTASPSLLQCHGEADLWPFQHKILMNSCVLTKLCFVRSCDLWHRTAWPDNISRVRLFVQTESRGGFLPRPSLS